MGIGNLGFSEMAIIFVIALIVFGPRRLPELGRSLGSAMREFRRSLNQIQREIEESDPRNVIRPPSSTSPPQGTAPPAAPTPPPEPPGNGSS